jgi:hypothetical protein
MEVISICHKLIKNEDSKHLLCPITWKRYINNEKLEMYIIIKDKCVDVINHTYYYNVPICQKSYDKIKRIFDGHVEIRRQQMEADIFRNVKNSLKNINTKLLNSK